MEERRAKQGRGIARRGLGNSVQACVDSEMQHGWQIRGKSMVEKQARVSDTAGEES